MPSKLDPYVSLIEGWLTAEPRLTAIAIVGRLAAHSPDQFGPPQHSIAQRLLKKLRARAAEKVIEAPAPAPLPPQPGAADGLSYVGLNPPPAPAAALGNMAS